MLGTSKSKTKIYAINNNEEEQQQIHQQRRRSSIASVSSVTEYLEGVTAVVNNKNFIQKLNATPSLGDMKQLVSKKSYLDKLNSTTPTTKQTTDEIQNNEQNQSKKLLLKKLHTRKTNINNNEENNNIENNIENKKVDIVYEAEGSFKYIIPYNNKYLEIWNIFIVLCSLYLCFQIPMSWAFDGLEFPSDLLLDMIFLIDIVINFRTGFVYNGKHITDPKLIAGHYIHTWFYIDLLASFPFELFFAGGGTARNSLDLLNWFRIPKLLRLGRLLKYLKRHIKYYFLVSLWLSLIMMIHVIGTMWITITNPCHIEEKTNICTTNEIWNIYIFSLYVAILILFNMSDVSDYTNLIDHIKFVILNNNNTSTTLYNDDENSQYWNGWSVISNEHSTDMIYFYILASFATFVGLTVICCLNGEIVCFSLNRSMAYNRFYNKVDEIKLEMINYNLDDDLQFRVQRYYDYLWINNKVGMGALNKGVLHDPDLSLPLKREIAKSVHFPLLEQVSIFKECSKDCLFAISLRLHTHVYLPGDVIFEKGDVAREFYLIRRGTILIAFGQIDNQLIGDVNENINSTSVLSMGYGSYFGELALITSMPRSCSVMSKTVSELSELSKYDFQQCMNEYPALSLDLISKLTKDYPGIKHLVQKTKQTSLKQLSKTNLTNDFIDDDLNLSFSSSDDDNDDDEVVNGYKNVTLSTKEYNVIKMLRN